MAALRDGGSKLQKRALLEAFIQNEPRGLTKPQLIKESKVPKTTIHRLVAEFVATRTLLVADRRGKADVYVLNREDPAVERLVRDLVAASDRSGPRSGFRFRDEPAKKEKRIRDFLRTRPRAPRVPSWSERAAPVAGARVRTVLTRLECKRVRPYDPESSHFLQREGQVHMVVLDARPGLAQVRFDFEVDYQRRVGDRGKQEVHAVIAGSATTTIEDAAIQPQWFRLSDEERAELEAQAARDDPPSRASPATYDVDLTETLPERYQRMLESAFNDDVLVAVSQASRLMQLPSLLLHSAPLVDIVGAPMVWDDENKKPPTM